MNLLNTIKGLYEKVDPQDTGGAEEASMIKGQIKQIKHYIEGIEKAVNKDGDVEEWVQNKLTKATDYLKSVYGYKLGQDDNGEMDEELKLTEEIEMAIEEGKRFGLTQSLLDAVKNVLAAETKPEDKMDPVDPKALKGKHADRKDKDIDNDGDVDDSDKYLHKRRQAVSKAVKENDEEMEDDDDKNKDDVKKSMAKNTDDDDEKSAEEKQKEKEYIAKKSDRKEPVDVKPTVKESLARKRLSGMMRDKANVKNVRIPTPAERRAEMERQKQMKKEELEIPFIEGLDEEEINKFLSLDELSYNKLAAYKKHAAQSKTDARDSRYSRDRDTEKAGKTIHKRDRGIARATRKQQGLAKVGVQAHPGHDGSKQHPGDGSGASQIDYPSSKEADRDRRAASLTKARADRKAKERHIFTTRDAAVKKQHELGGKARIVTGTGKSAGKYLVVTEDLDLYEVTAYRVVNKKGTTIKSFGTDGSAAAGLARTDPDYKVVTDNVPFTPDKPRKNPPATAGKKGLGHSIAKHLAKKGMASVKEEEQKEEMTPEQEKKREEIVMALKKKMPEFEAKYGDRAKEVMYATATKMAMKD